MNSVSGCPAKATEKSLAFAIDTSGSMDKVLKEMEKIVKDITQYVNTNSRISISKYILVPFNEEKRNEREFNYDQ